MQTEFTTANERLYFENKWREVCRNWGELKMETKKELISRNLLVVLPPLLRFRGTGKLEEGGKKLKEVLECSIYNTALAPMIQDLETRIVELTLFQTEEEYYSRLMRRCVIDLDTRRDFVEGEREFTQKKKKEMEKLMKEFNRKGSIQFRQLMEDVCLKVFPLYQQVKEEWSAALMDLTSSSNETHSSSVNSDEFDLTCDEYDLECDIDIQSDIELPKDE